MTCKEKAFDIHGERIGNKPYANVYKYSLESRVVNKSLLLM